MKTLLILLGALLALTTLVVAINAPPADAGAGQARYQVVADLDQADMLSSHQPMMEQMRSGVIPRMTERMPQDPMRRTLSSTMIDQMEQNQAEIDRMLGR